ncbi:hypothetical protein [Kaistella sp.]|uniref:hypothetical protein n=1 Tax=Kaistella sp. TaxID=2782235 RepID=UPI00359F42C0
MKTIVINKQQEIELNQIFNELVYSLKNTYSNEDLLKLTGIILKESGLQTYNSKKDITVSVLKTTGKYSEKIFTFTKTKFRKYKTNGLRNQFSEDLEFSKDFLINSPNKIIDTGISLKNKSLAFKNDFLIKSKNEKIELISVALMSLLIFFASAGGEDFEGGIPDSDLNIGIGFHRHILSHSIIIGFLVEFLMRAGIEVINKTYKDLPAEHHKFWDNANQYINKHKGTAIGSMWAGICVHLIKDSGILGHGMKPYNGIPLELSNATHQGIFAGNGALSGIFAYKK